MVCSYAARTLELSIQLSEYAYTMAEYFNSACNFDPGNNEFRRTLRWHFLTRGSFPNKNSQPAVLHQYRYYSTPFTTFPLAAPEYPSLCLVIPDHQYS